MVAALLVIGGLFALIGGAELVVRYGSSLAERLGIPPMIVGLTIVSIGTSAPELAVGIDAMKLDAGSLAVGNIAGTNIVNLLLILGLSATLREIHFERRTLVLDLPGMVLAAVLVLVLSFDGALQTWEGVPLVLAAIAYTVALGWWTRRESTVAAARVADEAVEARVVAPGDRNHRHTILSMLMLVAGMAVIVFGADWLVRGSVDLARLFGVSDAFIGLTVVAIGTSAPELVTTLVSTVRGNRDIAVGNLIGSSVYNLTLILGVPVLVANGSGPIDSHLLHVDLPIMVAVCLVCIPLFLTGRRLSRPEGVAMVIGYVAYLSYLVIARG